MSSADAAYSTSTFRYMPLWLTLSRVFKHEDEWNEWVPNSNLFKNEFKSSNNHTNDNLWMKKKPPSLYRTNQSNHQSVNKPTDAASLHLNIIFLSVHYFRITKVKARSWNKEYVLTYSPYARAVLLHDDFLFEVHSQSVDIWHAEAVPPFVDEDISTLPAE